jgi:hypothetical protein
MRLFGKSVAKKGFFGYLWILFSYKFILIAKGAKVYAKGAKFLKKSVNLWLKKRRL